MRNMDTGDLAVFHVDAWLSKSKDDQQLSRDIPATVRGKSALKRKLHCLSFLAERYRVPLDRFFPWLEDRPTRTLKYKINYKIKYNIIKT